jgi:hypothetical protein
VLNREALGRKPFTSFEVFAGCLRCFVFAGFVCLAGELSFPYTRSRTLVSNSGAGKWGGGKIPCPAFAVGAAGRPFGPSAGDEDTRETPRVLGRSGACADVPPPGAAGTSSRCRCVACSEAQSNNKQ